MQRGKVPTWTFPDYLACQETRAQQEKDDTNEKFKKRLEA